jgi:hypothetical protein
MPVKKKVAVKNTTDTRIENMNERIVKIEQIMKRIQARLGLTDVI